jgi:DNA polymerase-3 subunit delta'
MADKLNTAAANKLLKLLEEPTEKRFHSYSQKTKKISFKPFALDVKYFISMDYPANIAEALVSKKILTQNSLEKIAHQAQEISTKHCNYYNNR